MDEAVSWPVSHWIWEMLIKRKSEHTTHIPFVSCTTSYSWWLCSWTWSWTQMNDLGGLLEEICTGDWSSGFDVWPFSFLLLICFHVLFNQVHWFESSLSATQQAETFLLDCLIFILNNVSGCHFKSDSIAITHHWLLLQPHGNKIWGVWWTLLNV